MAGLWRSEVLRDRPSDDVQALIDQARLRKEHASAAYRVTLGELEVGELRSTVSGGQREEQLLYRIHGTLEQPARVRLSGFVLAGWDRRPERFVLEARTGGQRHRLEGGLRREPGGGVLFEARYLPPAGGAERRFDLVLPDAPILAPGPLPLPELGPGLAGLPAAGTVADPMTGEPVDWRIETSARPGFEAAGRPRDAVRHALLYGAWQASLWTESTGFPLRVELPLGFAVTLKEEKR